MPAKALLKELGAKTPLISVGIISADLMNLASDLAAIQDAGIEMIHFDVMDGCFCPTMTAGPTFVKGVKTNLLKDVHLMIEEPLEKLPAYVEAGADMITLHVESSRCIHRALQVLDTMTNVNDPARGIVRSIALSPGTPLELARPLLDIVDVVFLIAINPGWAGQRLPLETTQRRVKTLIEMIRQSRRNILVGVDGGVNTKNIGDIAGMGADIIVTGSAVFRPGTPRRTAAEMLKIVENAAASRP